MPKRQWQRELRHEDYVASGAHEQYKREVAAFEAKYRCHICGSTEHKECGFCQHCREHAVAVLDPELPPDHPEQEALTECCGASILGYDYDPPERD